MIEFDPTDLLIGEAQAILALGIFKSDMDYDGEMIVLATSNVANSTVAWTAQRDGFIFGFRSNLSSGFAAGINVDLPSTASNPAGGTVQTGLIDWTSSATQRDLINSPMMFPFKTGDSVKFRTLAATSLYVQLYVGYPRPTQADTQK